MGKTGGGLCIPFIHLERYEAHFTGGKIPNQCP